MLASYTPMAPTQVREPFHRDGWIYGEKVDGWRILGYKDGVRVRLVKCNGRDHTRRFAISRRRSTSGRHAPWKASPAGSRSRHADRANARLRARPTGALSSG